MGGGTVKFAVCQGGQVTQTAAIDIGARLVVTDESGRVSGLEEAGRRIAEGMGIELKLGERVSKAQLETMVAHMVDRLMEVIRLEPLSRATQQLFRTPPLDYQGRIDGVVFSGGVSEFIYNESKETFGDLGQLLAAAMRARLPKLGAEVLEPRAGIRATVIGASQYTVQVSGSTIYISSLGAVPVRNMPVVRPEITFAEEIDPAVVQAAVKRSLQRFDLHEAETPVALMLEWEGSATFHRLNGLCHGIIDGLNENLKRGNPVVLVSHGDIGGLLGIHMKEELRVPNPIISIDGIRLSEFDFVDIGNFIPSSGAVPVIIKSLVFPS
jgi:ethanolamine utilization protein EutA